MIVKRYAIIVSMIGVIIASAPEISADFTVKVSSNGRYFIRSDTKEPFFFLAHTGWDVFMYFTDKEADAYLEGCSSMGFTVIFTSLIGWMPDDNQTNAYGELPFINKDPCQPNEAYFRHVDYIVNKANSLGLCMQIAPAWREWINIGTAPRPFDSAEKAWWFGEYLGKRYKDNNVIWVVGGDHHFEGYHHIVKALAEGLGDGDENSHMITFHGKKEGPYIPDQSVYYDEYGCSHYFKDEEWLDYYSPYSGHQWAYPTWYLTKKNYDLTPVKPVVDCEPCYENAPYYEDGSRFYSHPNDWSAEDPRGTPALIREQAYWSMLAGACGHCYAHQCGNDDNDYDVEKCFAKFDAPGAVQMRIMKTLFESRPWHTMVPDQEIITAGQSSGYDENHIQAARASDGKFLFVYLPRDNEVTIALSKISGDTVKAYWFNPRTGEVTFISEYNNLGSQKFKPPSSGVDNDWILMLDDASQNYPPPEEKAAR